MDRTSSVPFVLTGRHVLALFVGFFVIVGTVNGVMLRAAMTTMPGSEARNGYALSQRFNAELAAAAEQEARGWQASAATERFGDGLAITITVRDRDGLPLAALAVEAVATHPTDRNLDQRLQVVEAAPGRYVARTERIADGAWTLVLQARDSEGAPALYTSRNRIQIGRAS